MRILSLFAALMALSLTAVAASGRTIRAQVTVLHQLPAGLAGARFAFAPTPEQTASAEFRGYQDQVRKGLVSHGLVEVALADADLAVGLLCIAVKGQPAASAPEVGAAASFGTNTRASTDAATGAPRISSSFDSMSGAGIDSSASGYTHRVTLMLYAVKSATGDKPREVYEGTSTSIGPSDELGAVAPKLIDSLVGDFPGTSGPVRTVRLACPECKR
jgi:hypothetical protein